MPRFATSFVSLHDNDLKMEVYRVEHKVQALRAVLSKHGFENIPTVEDEVKAFAFDADCLVEAVEIVD